MDPLKHFGGEHLQTRQGHTGINRRRKKGQNRSEKQTTMADIRFVRPPSDNKIRNFSPLPRTNETLHITTPKHTANQPPAWDFYFTTTPRPCLDANFSSQPVMKRKKSMDLPKGDHTDTANRNKEHENHNKGNKALFFHPSQRSYSLASMSKTSPPQGKLTIEGIVPTWAPDATISPGIKFTTGFETSTLHSPHEPDSIHLPQFIAVADKGNAHKCPVMQFYSSFTSATDNSLEDVYDEELEQLPEVQSPSGVFSSPARQPATSSCGLQKEASVDQSDQKNDETAINTTNRKPLPGRAFKRSVSSFDLEETKYTSFFGSLRKKETTEFSEDGEDDRGSPDYNFTTMWDLRRAWVLDSSIHRTQSADSLMEASKNLFRANPTNSHSVTPVERLLADDEENEEHDVENTTHCNGKTSQLARVESCDRLRMRRGALAQPERMIMSQAVREKVQKDVEKRKTSMVRRVSQFFNVQLRLNREEDLI